MKKIDCQLNDQPWVLKLSPINQHCTIILKFCPRVRDSVHHLTYLTLWQWLQYQKQQQRHAARYLVIQSRPSASLTLGWVFNFLLESLHQDKWFGDFFFNLISSDSSIRRQRRSRSLGGKSALFSGYYTLYISLKQEPKHRPPTRLP